MKNQRGFTLVEIMVSVAIMGIVTYAGVSAYQYFMGQSKKELKKLDDISEFTLFAKDIAKLAEGAGISTSYLNFPVAKTCSEDVSSPCLQTLDDREIFHPTAVSDLPSPLNNSAKTCVQFYKDAYGSYVRTKAFPGNPSRQEDVLSLEAFTYKENKKNIYATWPLVDENSKPFIVMKRRSDGLVLRLMGRPLSKDNPPTPFSFFKAEGDIVPSQIEGYPFLIYGSLYVNQYMIHIAKEVVVCSENKQKCEQEASKYNCLKLDNGGEIPSDCSSPQEIDIASLIMIDFKPLDESKRNAYFKDLTLSKLPSNCTEGWDRTRQTSFYPFPTNSMSLQPPLDGGNIGWSEAAIANFISSKGMQHFYELLPGNSSIAEGLMTAVPIDIVSYFVEVNNDGMNPSKNLMAAIYSENQVVAPRTKVRNLKAPFYFARKLGTQELSIWYNPK